MKLNCLIADDEKMARALLQDYIAQTPNLELVAVCKDGVEVIKALQERNIDLLFLDIQMPHLKGTEVARTLVGKDIQIIFTTAYDNFALEAFDLSATDYLLKPFPLERFQLAVDKAIKQIAPSKNIQEVSAPTFMMVKSEHKLVKVHFDEIYYVEALREYVRIISKDEQIITLETMKNMEALLPDNFIRIHKSYIIAFDKIKAVYGNQLEISTAKLPIGRTYKKVLMGRLG